MVKKKLKKLTLSYIFVIFQLRFDLIFPSILDKTGAGQKWQTLANLESFLNERSLSPLSNGVFPKLAALCRNLLLNDKVNFYP